MAERVNNNVDVEELGERVKNLEVRCIADAARARNALKQAPEERLLPVVKVNAGHPNIVTHFDFGAAEYDVGAYPPPLLISPTLVNLNDQRMEDIYWFYNDERLNPGNHLLYIKVRRLIDFLQFSMAPDVEIRLGKKRMATLSKL